MCCILCEISTHVRIPMTRACPPSRSIDAEGPLYYSERKLLSTVADTKHGLYERNLGSHNIIRPCNCE